MYFVPSVLGESGVTANQSIVRLTDNDKDGQWGEVEAGEVEQIIVENLRIGFHTVLQMQAHGNSLYVNTGSRTNTGEAYSPHPRLGEYAYTGVIACIEDSTEVTDTLTSNVAWFPEITTDIEDCACDSDTAIVYKTATQPFILTEKEKLRVFSTGFRNPYGFVIHPDGDIWVTNNGNATFGDELYPTSFLADHGFPKWNDKVGNWRNVDRNFPDFASSQMARNAGYFGEENFNGTFKTLGTEEGGPERGGLVVVSPFHPTVPGYLLVTLWAWKHVIAVDPSNPPESAPILISAKFNKPLDIIEEPNGNFLVAGRKNGRRKPYAFPTINP